NPQPGGEESRSGPMSCPSCGEVNNPDRLYCARCGGTLGRRCAACGGQNEPRDQFCGRCGTTLAATSSPGPAPARTAFAGGRDQVRRVLGEGGKKRVYLATALRLDRDIALAVIK